MENTLNKKELDDVFLDVRKSYRLLYSYQRRVMDLVQFIEEHFDSKVRNAYHFIGRNNQSVLPSQNSWDYLLFYNCPYSMLITDANNVALELAIVIVSDTGLFDEYPTTSSKNQSKINEFSPVEISRTQIHLILKKDGSAWHDYIEIMFKGDSEQEYIKKTDISDLLIGKKYDLSDFMNEENTLMQLKDFEDFCIKNGITLHPKKTD
jgi:hypothetical protein